MNWILTYQLRLCFGDTNCFETFGAYLEKTYIFFYICDGSHHGKRTSWVDDVVKRNDVLKSMLLSKSCQNKVFARQFVFIG